MLWQVRIERGSQIIARPISVRPAVPSSPEFRPLVVNDGEAERHLTWASKDNSLPHIPEGEPRQLLGTFVVICEALRADTQREPQFDAPKDVRHEIIWELTPDHRSKHKLLGGTGGGHGVAILVLTNNPAREGPERVASALPVARHETAAQLLRLHGRGVHEILNVSAPVDPLERESIQREWIPRAQSWEADVFAIMKEAGCSPDEIHFVKTFPLPALRRTDFLYQMNSQWSISDVRRERLEKVIDRYLDQPLFSNGSALPISPTVQFAVFDWRPGESGDSRIEYRDWAHLVFRIRSPRKERVRAYLEISRDGSTSADRRNAEIAGPDWHQHEVPDLRPGDQYSVPAFLRLPEPVHLWLDERRYSHIVAYEPQLLAAGSYLTDSAFLNDLHRQQLAVGVYRLRVVISIGDVSNFVEHATDWHTFTVA
jgi:hypothetical protein